MSDVHLGLHRKDGMGSEMKFLELLAMKGWAGNDQLMNKKRK